jgi:large subunit ribosomal protein L29
VRISEAVVKGSEVNELTDEQLAAAMRDTRDALFNLRFQNAQGALERTAEIRGRKRDIARLLTAARAREIARQQEAAGA